MRCMAEELRRAISQQECAGTPPRQRHEAVSCPHDSPANQSVAGGAIRICRGCLPIDRRPRSSGGGAVHLSPRHDLQQPNGDATVRRARRVGAYPTGQAESFGPITAGETGRAGKSKGTNHSGHPDMAEVESPQVTDCSRRPLRPLLLLLLISFGMNDPINMAVKVTAVLNGSSYWPADDGA